MSFKTTLFETSENKAMLKYSFLAIVFLLSTYNAFGCSLYLSPTTDFDTTHYIFIGNVIEEIKLVKYSSRGEKLNFVGLKIKVSENIYSPKPTTYFEVFPLSLTPGCALISDTKEIREHFPVGSQVRVVAKEASVFFKNQPVESSIIRLETSIYNRGSIARNDLSENLRVSAKSFYAYDSFSFGVQQRTTEGEYVLSASNYYLPEFELRKDLFRLKETKSEDERTKILERLVYYPHVNNINFPKIARTYIKSQDKLAVLEKLWEQRVQEIYPKRR